MLIYIFVNIIIIFLGFLYEIVKSKENRLNFQGKNKKLANFLFIIPSFILLFMVSSFRGDFATDYNNYVYLFKLYNQFGFFEVFRMDIYQEVGFIFLNRIIGIFTDNTLYVFVVVSFTIVLCFYSQFRKYSPYIWISVLMFVTIGAYYTSFNIMRQILSVSIIFIGSKYLYERKLIKYSLIVLLAALFHRSALIMLIFYFVLNYKFNFKKFLVIITVSVVTMLFIEDFLLVIQTFFYSVYTQESYGMTGLKYTNAILPISILIFTLLHFKIVDMKNIQHKVCINAVIFYAFFSILGLKIQMIQRIADFFAPYILLLVPIIISKIKNKNIRLIYIMAAIVILITYNFLVLKGSGYDPYYFIWESK